jgi:MoxR-like ATPase
VTGGDEAQAQSATHPSWWIYRGTGRVLDQAERDQRWPEPPHWRDFRGGPDERPPPQDDRDVDRRLGAVTVSDHVDDHEVNMVNAALYLRRPLLVTGRPGSGKSSLAYKIARELRLGRVLRWPITTRTTLRSGLYDYDAIGRVQAASQRRASTAPANGGPAGGSDPDHHGEPPIGDFVHLGPLGTALLPYRLPRVLLIDELDKSDIDLPNDLLNVFEDGEFEIPELVRVRARTPEVAVHTADPGGAATVRAGRVACHAFPVVVISSNGERDFPPAFLRRCLQLELPDPDADKLAQMVAAHFPAGSTGIEQLLHAYLDRRERVGGLAADQLLNAVQLATSGAFTAEDRDDWDALLDAVWHRLSPAAPS